jgi:hypothetical protein
VYHRQQHQQSDGRLNRPKGAIRPSGFWISAKLAAAREHYDAVQEGHSYVYSQSPHSAHPRRRVVILGPRYAAISEPAKPTRMAMTAKAARSARALR